MTDTQRPKLPPEVYAAALTSFEYAKDYQGFIDAVDAAFAASPYAELIAELHKAADAIVEYLNGWDEEGLSDANNRIRAVLARVGQREASHDD